MSVDIIKKKAYVGDDDSYSEMVFKFLDDKLSMPEDFYSAPREVAEEASILEQERDEIQRNALEGFNNE